MKEVSKLKFCLFSIASFCTIVSYTNCVIAEIIPDNTLPNNSKVKVEGNKSTIEGGTTTGGNLFHSFEKFGVPTGGEAHFNNAIDIQNIITRVTGKSISDIDGLIKANGAANLFLINPNGIIFGENARLDIGGSFFGTSADSMKFGDDIEFSAKNPQSKPLLTMNVPIGLQFGANPGLIQVQGNGQGRRIGNSQIIDTQDALRVQSDKTLALVGGEVSLQGATLKTAGGRIELGSVAENGLVTFNPNNKGFVLDYGGVENFADITLSQQTNVDASGEGAGDVRVQGKRVTLTDGSQIETSTLGTENGGDLVVNATESLEVIGKSGFFADVYREATGNGGNLKIKTGQLLVQDGASILAFVLGSGNGADIKITTGSLMLQRRGNIGTVSFDNPDMGRAGTLTVNASDSVELIGTTRSGTRLFTPGTELTITTGSLIIQDGAKVTAFNSRRGLGAPLTIRAREFVEITGKKSLLSTQTIRDKKGGDLMIDTGRLIVKDGAAVKTGTSTPSDSGPSVITGEGKLGTGGQAGILTVNATESVELIGKGSLLSSETLNAGGVAGEMKINTGKLIVQDGAEVLTSAGSVVTDTTGQGGDLTVNAKDYVEVSGTRSLLSSEIDHGKAAGNLTINTGRLIVKNGAEVSASTYGTGQGGTLNVNASDSVKVIGTSANNVFPSRLTTKTRGAGDAGNLIINTGKLIVQDSAEIDVSSSELGSNQAQGNAGNLEIKTGSIQLDRGKLTSETTSGTGGNITLQDHYLLFMGNNSQISSTAGTAGAAGNGGNITINASDGFIIANPTSNNDIFANAYDGEGGKVKINATGIFGISVRSREDLAKLLRTNTPAELDPRQLPTSDITAISQTSPNLSGSIEIITPQTDPNNGLVKLPTIPAEAEVANACSTPGYAQSSFTITGKGSLPPSPLKPLTGSVNRTSLATLDGVGDVNPQPRRSTQAPKQKQEIKQIVDARGWVRTPDGKIILVAHATQNTNYQGIKKFAHCKSMNN